MILKRYFNKAIMLLKIKINEKNYNGIRYLLKYDTSKYLIVSFSAFSDMGKPPRYNYIDTLKDIDANQLFILDNYGFNKAGAYYLGENGIFNLPDKIVELIDTVKQKVNAQYLIMVGTSKGGVGALIYGILCEADNVIIGAPQFYLGDYLNTEKHLPILEGIMGETGTEAVEKLNQVVKDIIIQAKGKKKKPQIYLHYSPQEHTYSEQIIHLIHCLEENGFKIFHDNEYRYKLHSEVGRYYIPFLLKTIKRFQDNNLITKR